MNRKQFIQKYFQKKDQLTVQNKQYRTCLIKLFNYLSKTDSVKNDITTKTLNLKKSAATITAKQDGVVAGIEEIKFIIKHLITLISSVNDGTLTTNNQQLITIKGSTNTLLSYERTILNILGRMSGIATQTSNLVKKIQTIPNPPFIAATRKTPWTLIDKKAVSVGGGLTHRLNLADEIMIKDNHLKALQKEKDFSSIKEVIKYVLEKMFKDHEEYFEIEVATLSQAKTVIKTIKPFGHLAIALLLDNWKSIDIKRFIEKVKKTDIYNRVIFEASGDITEKNILDWAQTGVDILSLGSLTHSAKNFNVSMNF